MSIHESWRWLSPALDGLNGDTGFVGRYPPNGRSKCRNNRPMALSPMGHKREHRTGAQAAESPAVDYLTTRTDTGEVRTTFSAVDPSKNSRTFDCRPTPTTTKSGCCSATIARTACGKVPS